MDPMSLMGLSLGGGMMNNIFSVLMSLMGNSFNQDQVQQMEAFQKEMSSTAYQRSVQDMEKAGINPILAASRGGASAPSGGSASFVAPQISDIMSPAISTAMSKMKLDQELKNNALGDVEQVQRINSLAAGQAKSAAETVKTAADTQGRLIGNDILKPDALRAKADALTLSSSAVQAARSASTAAEEAARGVGAVKDAISPFVPAVTAKRTYNYYGGM